MFAYGEDCMLVLTRNLSQKKKKRNLSQKEFQNFDPAGIPIGICWDSRKWGMQPEGLPRDQPH